MTERLPTMTLAQCAEAGTLAYILMEARSSLQQAQGLMERLDGGNCRAGKAIFEETSERSRNICSEAEKRLRRLNLDPGRSAQDALSLWQRLIEHSYRCEA